MSQRVSVVMPAFNAEAFISEALASIAVQGVDTQVIVVDDASGDGSARLAAVHPGVTVITRESNGGIAAARNTGISAATGEYLAFLDADDLWPPGSLAARLEVLEGNAWSHGVFGQAVQFGDELAESSPLLGAAAGGLLVRRDSFLRVGPFDEALRIGEFIDWYARARDAGLRFAEIETVVLRRRIHANNTTRSEAQLQYTRVLRAALQRRRSAQ